MEAFRDGVFAIAIMGSGLIIHGASMAPVLDIRLI
jgi:hypothetical protein